MSQQRNSNRRADRLNTDNPFDTNSKSITLFLRATPNSSLGALKETLGAIHSKYDITKEELKEMQRGYVYCYVQIKERIEIDMDALDEEFDNNNVWDLLGRKYIDMKRSQNVEKEKQRKKKCKKKNKKYTFKELIASKYTFKCVQSLTDPFKSTASSYMGINMMNHNDITSVYNDNKTGENIIDHSSRMLVTSVAATCLIGIMKGLKPYEIRTGGRPLLDADKAVKYKYNYL